MIHRALNHKLDKLLFEAIDRVMGEQAISDLVSGLCASPGAVGLSYIACPTALAPTAIIAGGTVTGKPMTAPCLGA